MLTYCTWSEGILLNRLLYVSEQAASRDRSAPNSAESVFQQTRQQGWFRSHDSSARVQPAPRASPLTLIPFTLSSRPTTRATVLRTPLRTYLNVSRCISPFYSFWSICLGKPLGSFRCFGEWFSPKSIVRNRTYNKSEEIKTSVFKK